MKKLFISDLDGTLLNNNAEISEFSKLTINSLINSGLTFAFATARTSATVKKILADVKINAPCILMNGVSIYDFKNDTYIKNEYINLTQSRIIAQILQKHNINGFMYKIAENKMSAEFTELDSDALKNFYYQRKKRYDKPFKKVESFLKSADENVIYFAILNTFDKLSIIKSEIANLPNVRFEFYEDTYSENLWYLEIFSDKASKLTGINYLKKNYGFDYITSFGDNLNDIPLFKASDMRVAVENAKPQLKEFADFICDSNTNDGVAKWLLTNKKGLT